MARPLIFSKFALVLNLLTCAVFASGCLSHECHQPCSAGVGACEVQGTTDCSGKCITPQPAPIPTVEVCDGIDNDCNGMVDDGLVNCVPGHCQPGSVEACGSSVGSCHLGQRTCLPSHQWSNCLGAVMPTDEQCDGLDNNCDGVVDNLADGSSCACTSGAVRECGSNVGACHTGNQSCGSQGAWSVCSAMGPLAESCDGIDNDCNGVIDDNVLTALCDEQRGACLGSRKPCQGTTGEGSCGAINYGPFYEPVEQTCDGIDNDCDGTVDRRCVTTMGGGLGDSVGSLAEAARFRQPRGLMLTQGGTLYVADSDNHLIKAVDLKTGMVSRVAGTGQPGNLDGPAAQAVIDQPTGLAFDELTGNLYFSDSSNNSIRMLANGTVTTLSSNVADFADGALASAQFARPTGLLLSEGKLYVADTGNLRVRAIDLTTQTVATVAGTGAVGVINGPIASARLSGPRGLAMLPSGDLAIADGPSHAIRVLSNGVLSTLVGQTTVSSGVTVGLSGFRDGSLANGALSYPSGLWILADGTLLVADTGNSAIRQVSTNGISTVSGNGSRGHVDGLGEAASFDLPEAVVSSSDGMTVYVADTDANTVRRVSL